MIDPAQLAVWFEAHAAPLVLYARQWVGGRGRAEDVVQEVFVRLMALPAEPPNVRAWLHASVRHAAIDEARSSSRRKEREQTVARDRAGNWFDPRPDDLLDAEAAQAALERLPARQREVVLLRVWSGMTLSEVSQVTGLPVSTAHDEYRRGLDALRRIMEKPCPTTTTTDTTTAG
jgi:RNA polymerase sigma-70 factor, ECF subfamily